MTVFDALLLTVVGVSVFFAAIRGAMREGATLAALAVAVLAAWLGMKPAAAALGQSSFFISAAIGGIIGLGVFFGSYFLLHKAMLRVKLKGRMQTFNKVGGAAFGLLRAMALIGLGFLGYGYYLEEANQPDSVRKALLLPIASASAGFFEQFAPPNRDLGAAKNGNVATDGYDGRDRTGLKEIVTTVTTTDKTAAPKSGDPIADILTEETTSDGKPNQ